MSLIIPTQPVPAQTFNVIVDDQNVNIRLRTLGTNLYFSLEGIATTRICRNKQRLLADAKYHGFRGDFVFLDTQGQNDPKFPGLGGRYRLVYLNAGE